MAILGSTYWNLIDVLKSGNDGIGDVVEALTQLTPFMKDANVISCNSGTEHRSSIRTGLPSVSWGALYQGIAQSKGNYTEVKDTTGFVEGLSSVDERLLNLKPAEAAKLQSAGTNFSIVGSILNSGSNPLVPGVLFSVG